MNGEGHDVVMSLGVQEQRQLRIAKELRARTVNKLWKITEELNILYRENWTVLADQEMIKFQNELLTGKANCFLIPLLCQISTIVLLIIVLAQYHIV